MKRLQQSLETAVIHAGSPDKRIEGAVVFPIFQSATFEYSGQGRYEDLRYIRLNNTPGHLCLQRKLAALEGGESAVVTSSGMAAIASTLLAVVKNGDHILAQDCLYGGTRSLITRELASLGIRHDFIDAGRPETWIDCLQPNTRAFFVETISNPLVRIGELVEVVRFARKHGLLAIIDNTFATPVNFRPLEHGFDLVVHSCTKYLNGHSDLVAGAVVGPRSLVEEVNRKVLHYGGCLDPHACFLLDRGIKTLALRVKQQNQSAERLSRFLADHPKVSRVHHPSLEAGLPGPETRGLFGGFGGMLSFEVAGGPEEASRLIRSLQIPVEAPSLGGVESLVTRPSTTSHSGWSREEREAAGISEGLIRFSVGIEGTDDLLEDLEQALDQI